MDLQEDDPHDCPRCLHALRWTGTDRYPFWECAHCGFFAATL
jgi:ribosomal protein L37AE/L43A